MALSNQSIKNGLEALKPVSILVALGGAFVLYKYGYSLTPFTWTTAGGYALVGVGALSYGVDYIGSSFL